MAVKIWGDRLTANSFEGRKHLPGKGDVHMKMTDEIDGGYDAAVAAVTVPDMGIDPKECAPVENRPLYYCNSRSHWRFDR